MPCEITLTQGQIALVDEADFDALSQYSWYTAVYHQAHRILMYAARMIRVEPGQKRQTLLMHHVLLLPRTGFTIDHKDGNGLNNQRTNIRYATRQQQMQNTGKYVPALSKFKGVSWDRSRQRWIMDIMVNGVRYRSYHPVEVEAARAYNDAARTYFGEYARLNSV